MNGKIALVVASFPKLSETFIVSKFLGMLDAGWDVYIVCADSPEDEFRHFPELAKRADARGRIKVAWPERTRWAVVVQAPVAFARCLWANPRGSVLYVRRGTPRFGWRVLQRLYTDAQFVALGPDLVHFEFGALAAERAYLKALLGCKLTVSFRGYDLNFCGLESPDYYRGVWQEADALHLLGEDLWSRAMERGCPTAKPHVLIPPALNLAGIDQDTLRCQSRGEPLTGEPPRQRSRHKGHESTRHPSSVRFLPGEESRGEGGPVHGKPPRPNRARIGTMNLSVHGESTKSVEQSGQNRSSEEKPIRILSIGRLEWKKGYEYALEAVRFLKDARVNCHYLIIGAGSYLEPLTFARYQLGLEKEVRFVGAIPPSEVRDHLSNADIFLHASVSEGFCNAVIEAQAAGLPVVCSDAGGLPENVRDGETGFVVPRRDARALASKLEMLARSSTLRKKMGQCARQRAFSHFQLHTQLDAFGAFYRGVLEADTAEGKPNRLLSDVIVGLCENER